MPAASNVAPAETVHRSVRLRLLPESRQVAHKLAGTAGACRFVWNHFVARTQQEYSFREVRYVLKYLADAYQSFFQGTRAYPRFQSRHRRRDGFTIPEGVQVQAAPARAAPRVAAAQGQPPVCSRAGPAGADPAGRPAHPTPLVCLSHLCGACGLSAHRRGQGSPGPGPECGPGNRQPGHGVPHDRCAVPGGQGGPACNASRRASNEVLCGRGGLGAS